MMSDTTKNNEMAAATTKTEKKLHKILTQSNAPHPCSDEFRSWFLLQFNLNGHNDDDECSLETFAVYFLNTIRQRTYVHLRSNDQNDTNDEPQSGGNTPVKSLKTFIDVNEKRKNANCRKDLISPETSTPVKFTNVSNRNASTPLRRGLNSQEYSQQPQQQNQRRSIDNAGKNLPNTPNSNNNSLEKSRNSSGNNSSIASSGFCLGDFLTSSTINNRHSNSQKKKSNSQHNQTTTSGGSSNKPKKRVVPISVSKTTKLSFNDSSPFGVNSSFSADNNILTISQTELGDCNERAIAETRKALKKDLTEVNSKLKASRTEITQSMQQMEINYEKKSISKGGGRQPLNDCINFNKLPKETLNVLQLLATIYGILMDMNFILNILNEISFLLNLMNANLNSTASRMEKKKFEYHSPSNDSFELLTEAINCIYFAMCVLEYHSNTLALMDAKSVGVVLQCERLICASPRLKASLTMVYEQKQALSTATVHDVFVSGLKNVCFQEDSDSRKFFSSTNEFSAFKTQRDLFYMTLKFWEKYHLHPSWNFAVEMAPKVREIFRQSENSVNMTHFAKLFVSQLLISANEQTSPEDIGIGNDYIDSLKFNKLTQRLIAPSNFSVDYQFPREQAFFRDFIIESRSVPFIEHLKIMLYSELITLNDSTFEQLNLMIEEGQEGDRIEHEDSEFIVRPTVLASILILAKFLGFVTALPFHSSTGCEITNTAIIQSYQLGLRRPLQPPIDICELLDIALFNRRHLTTIPWLVQYMAMLDDVTLQLQHFTKAIEKLFGLYVSLGNGQIQLMPISQFIVRCCIGWLFEQKPFIAAEYYIYRTVSPKLPILKTKSSVRQCTIDTQMQPILESILSVACPFLAEFRVSIMPAKYALTKYVSRSGRYRHITPCLTELPKITDKSTLTSAKEENFEQHSESPTISAAKQRQKKLMESFLHAQNSSMRRLIVFLTERVYKCVVKDAQYKILMPSKSTADNCVNNITSCHHGDIYNEVNSIYQNARYEALKQWDLLVPEMINERTLQGLDALLPIETIPIIKHTYAWRIKSDASIKIEQWRHMNLIKNNFYCNDPFELTEKLCKANINRSKQPTNQTTELKLIKSNPSISDLIEEMQHWLYTTGSMTSYRPEISPIDLDQQELGLETSLIVFLGRLKSSFENTLPTIYYRLIGSGLVQLLQHLITSTPQYLTDELIEAVCEFFRNEKIRIADIVTMPLKTISTNLNTTLNPNESSNATQNVSTIATTATTTIIIPEATTIYHALITAPFIESLGNCQIRYEKLKSLLTSMIQHGVISLDFVNELFVIIFKEDLRSCVFNEVSKMLKELAQETNRNICSSSQDNGDSDSEDGRKSQLFMEVLADFSRDLDEF